LHTCKVFGRLICVATLVCGHTHPDHDLHLLNIACPDSHSGWDRWVR